MTTFYDEIGQMATFEGIVDRFYDGVATDDLLRPMYPEADLTGARRRLTLFLAQYWGGPTTYSEERGHPRLRMRHAPFPVTPEASERWLHHFRTAMDGAGLTPEQDARLWDYIAQAALFLVNTMDTPAPQGVGSQGSLSRGTPSRGSLPRADARRGRA